MEVTNFTQTDFQAALDEPGVVVVDFWAGWCGPCKVMAPHFERAAELRPSYRFGKVDVDAEPALAGSFGVQSIPTLLVFRDGKPVASHSGVVGAEQLVRAIDGAVGEPLAASA